MFKDIINLALSCIHIGTAEDAVSAHKFWFSNSEVLYIKDLESYNECLESIYSFDDVISSRFSRKTVFTYLDKELPKLKRTSTEYEGTEKEFYKDFFDVKARDLIVTAPVSGVRLDSGIRKFNLSIYSFGYLEDLELPLSMDKGMYVSVTIKNCYDKEKAIQKASDSFSNLSRLLVLISGKQDKNILIETGLPLKKNISHEKMYVNTSSYQVHGNDGIIQSGDIKNQFLEKLPLDNDFFYNNASFKRLWSIYERKHNDLKVSDLELRILNSSLALGESALTKDTRNSIIYTCISLEILFSLNEGALFQSSIGENISNMFSFIVAKDLNARLKMKKLIKKVYGLRSAIVHGGNKELTDENLVVNIYMRAAISELLNNDKFTNSKRIQDLYEQLSIAQNSYL